METIFDYLEDRRLSEQEFEARHPHPFLIIEGALDLFEKDEFAFRTKSLELDRTNWVDPIEELHNDGKQLSERSLELLIFKVAKKKESPYQRRISIGRTNASDITIPDKCISKLHAHIEHDEKTGAYSIVDTESINGTKVNGVEIGADERRVLGYGDTIELGSFIFKFISAADLYQILRAAIVPSPVRP
ncbi:MAG: FHA domain-containing protein [Deltaproteobacteria bacterium]|nr:FHA domain-containing protein [Deltaproteobacteria bacterium]